MIERFTESAKVTGSIDWLIIRVESLSCGSYPRAYILSPEGVGAHRPRFKTRLDMTAKTRKQFNKCLYAGALTVLVMLIAFNGQLIAA